MKVGFTMCLRERNFVHVNFVCSCEAYLKHIVNQRAHLINFHERLENKGVKRQVVEACLNCMEKKVS